jgi:hypothetical protein
MSFSGVSPRPPRRTVSGSREVCADVVADSTKGLTVNRTNIDEVVEMLNNAETVVIVSVARQECAELFR